MSDDVFTSENHPCRRQADILESCKARFLSWDTIAPRLVWYLFGLITAAILITAWVVSTWLITTGNIRARLDNHETRVGKMEIEWNNAVPKLDSLNKTIREFNENFLIINRGRR